MHTILTSQGNRIKVTDSQFTALIKVAQHLDTFSLLSEGKFYNIPLNQFRNK